MGAAEDVSVLRCADTKALPPKIFKIPATSITELLPSPVTSTEELKASSTLVLPPSYITQDFDRLRFECAAFDQLEDINQRSSNELAALSLEPDPKDHVARTLISPAHSTLLISSPYNSVGHYLDLSTLSTTSILFAKALTALRPARSDYAIAPYTEALNFSAVLQVLRDLASTEAISWPATSFYVVVFRSELKANVDQNYLYQLDSESHREACDSGGLLKYWFGKMDSERRNLATCFWHSRADAYRGGLGPWHKKARAAGRDLYEKIVFSTYRCTVSEGARQFRWEDWSDAE